MEGGFVLIALFPRHCTVRASARNPLSVDCSEAPAGTCSRVPAPSGPLGTYVGAGPSPSGVLAQAGHSWPECPSPLSESREASCHSLTGTCCLPQRSQNPQWPLGWQPVSATLCLPTLPTTGRSEMGRAGAPLRGPGSSGALG